jgi:heptosyltransferase III
LRRLLIRPGGIGDCILALPALEHLKAGYTEVWVRSEVVPLIRFADCVQSIASLGLDLAGLPGVEPPPALIERLGSFDSIVSWYGSNRPEFREQVRALGLPFEFHPALPPAGESVHASDFFLRQVGGAGAAVPRIPCPPAAPGDFAVIHPFSGSARKNWPLDRFRELAERLPLAVRWCAGPEESLDEAVRMPDLYQLGCWLRGARLYIGNDSGITHLAAAVGTPVVAIFGPSDPAVWAPRGGQVRMVSGNLSAIGVEQVLAASIQALAEAQRTEGENHHAEDRQRQHLRP